MEVVKSLLRSAGKAAIEAFASEFGSWLGEKIFTDPSEEDSDVDGKGKDDDK